MYFSLVLQSDFESSDSHIVHTIEEAVECKADEVFLVYDRPDKIHKHTIHYLLSHPMCERVLINSHNSHDDDHQNILQELGYFKVSDDSKDSQQFHRFKTDEHHYLQLVKKVLINGETRTDRTGVGTVSMFGPQLVFDLSAGFPLLTTKRLKLTNILHEVLWYISGATNTDYLTAHGVNVWHGNTTREFLDTRGLTDYDQGETGPLYGFQWRHFGGDFRDVQRRPGIDQLARLLSILRSDPYSRRMYMSAWNPADLDKMCLEPCHVSFQLYVRDQTFLDGKLYLRSNDLFLGAPWNIAAYSLLLYMFAHLSGYTPGRLVYTIGDAHVYLNHFEAVRKQLARPTRPFPQLSIVDESKSIRDFSDFRVDHFHLTDYHPRPMIRADMAV